MEFMELFIESDCKDIVFIAQLSHKESTAVYYQRIKPLIIQWSYPLVNGLFVFSIKICYNIIILMLRQYI